MVIEYLIKGVKKCEKELQPKIFTSPTRHILQKLHAYYVAFLFFIPFYIVQYMKQQLDPYELISSFTL